jgi:hypothetical protein
MMLVAGECFKSVTQSFTAELTANPNPDGHAGILIYTNYPITTVLLSLANTGEKRYHGRRKGWFDEKRG